MKLTNRTKWRTDDLRQIIVRGLKEWDRDPAVYRVTVVPARQRRWATGCAAIGFPRMTLRIPSPRFVTDEAHLKHIVGDLAHVVEHEIWHTMGMSHDDMRRAGHHERAGARPETPPEWVAGMTLRAKEERTEAVDPQARVDEREEKARRMLERWERRMKLAKRKVAKYAAKVRYYEKRRAAGIVAKPRAPRTKKDAPPCVRFQISGAVAGEFGCLILDLSSESDDDARRAMADYVLQHKLPFRGGLWSRECYKIPISAESVPHITTLLDELTAWEDHNEITSRSFRKLHDKIKSQLGEHEKKQ